MNDECIVNQFYGGVCKYGTCGCNVKHNEGLSISDATLHQQILNLELREEIERLKKIATQHGARMQIMRDWINRHPQWMPWTNWESFVIQHPEAADWFDEEGVLKGRGYKQKDAKNTEIHALREKIARMYDEYAGTPCERIRHMEEVAELREENQKLEAEKTEILHLLNSVNDANNRYRKALEEIITSLRERVGDEEILRNHVTTYQIAQRTLDDKGERR